VQTSTNTEESIQLLLQFGADPAHGGINDATALHMAVAVQNKRAVARLLAAGADPRLLDG
jgi:ankyrin repeat protein